MPRTTNADEFGIVTAVDSEKRQFLITVEFAPEKLPYYPVIVAGLIVGRSPTAMYKSLEAGRYGLEGVLVEGVAHISHDSLLKYLKVREASAEGKLAKKAQSVKKMARRVHSRAGPRPPISIVATQTAQDLLDGGKLDFLNDLTE